MKKLLCLALALVLAQALAACVNEDITLSPNDTTGTQAPSNTPEPTNVPHTHSYGNWTVVTDATCTTDGLKERVCSCGEKETQKILTTGAHEYVNGICSVCGEKEKLPSEGLEYVLNTDGESYSVSGDGSCTDTDIVIPSTYNDKPVTGIGDSAFYDCSGLTSITIPDSVTSIGVYAFASCNNLTITIAAGNSFYHIAENCLIETKTKTLIHGCDSSVIPSDGSVASIGLSAFYGCSKLTCITIPDSVTSIGQYAFAFCDGLTSITIPDSVTSIGEGLFLECTRLTSVTIGNGVTSIDDGAFLNCGMLTSVTIPDSVTSIGEYVFAACYHLTSITFKGTKSQWTAIRKGSNWNDKTGYTYGSYTIYCTDGEISK